MELNRALEHALDGDAILFAGAGFSRGATNLRGEAFKTGRQLAAHLSKRVGLPSDTPLEDASEEFAKTHGDDSLIAELKEEFTARDIAPYHLEIARLPWRRVYTTNYDNVLETAATKTSSRLNPVTLSDAIHSTPKDRLSVHLNGYIDRLDRATLWSEFKLTDTSYVAASVLESPWLVFLRQDLRLARAVFFVGYSVADLDIRRLLFDTTESREKTLFVLGSSPNALLVRRASRFGTVLTLDTAALGSLATSTTASYSPKEPLERTGLSVQRFRAPEELPALSDQAVFDLLLRGMVAPDLVWSTLHGGPRYVLERSTAARVADQLTGEAPIAVVHSDLGNGKTLLIETVKCRLVEHGYDVYAVTQRSDDTFQELDAVLGSVVRTLLVIDDYPDWLDVIEYVGSHRRPECALLLSARTAVNDVMVDRVCALLGRSSVAEFSVDRLAQGDLEWLVDYLDEYGLWAERAAWSRERKLAHLQYHCESQFHAILLTVLESPQILARLDTLFQELKKQRGYYDVMLAVLALAVLQYRTSIDTLVDVYGERVLETGFRKNAAVRQLCDFRQGEVLLRSAVVAQFILQRVADAGVVVETLIQMARVADRAAAASPVYFQLLRSLMRFSALQVLLPEQNRKLLVVRYYENLKNLGGCKRNPHFWLQYAIATVVVDELERAERYFDTAYSLAGRWPDYDTYMIDNHFARFLLIRAIERDDIDTCMGDFRRARKIIHSQIEQERLHYPYRVALLYRDFYEAFESRLSAGRRAEVGRAAKHVADRIAGLPEDRQRHKYVTECWATMEDLHEHALATTEEEK